MSDNSNFGFAKLVPGFDFLQNLAKGATHSLPQMPTLSSWIAPTLNVEELEKRIAELKTVQFWLEQNGRALGATIQALEVQKMTLSTLEGMNVSMGELANALKVRTTETMTNSARKVTEAAEAAANAVSGVADAARKGVAGKKADEKSDEKVDEKADEKAQATSEDAADPKPERKASGNGAAPIDPLQWWGALTQQFQQIAAGAMKDAVQKTSAATARNMAEGKARQAAKSAAGHGTSAKATPAKGASGKSAARGSKAASPAAPASGSPAPAKRAAPRKSPARKAPARKTPSA